MKKFILLSCLIILLPFLGYFIDENFILDSDLFLSTTVIMVGTFIVIKYPNKYGILLWMTGVSGPRIYYSISAFSSLSENISIWYLAFQMICQLAICMCFCRLALQWTISTWLLPDQLTEKTKKHLHFFWKSYLWLEELLFIAISAGVTQLIASSLNNIKIMENIVFKAIPVWIVCIIYKKIKLNSIRILSPIAIKLESEKINSDIDKALNEEHELKNCLEKILSTSNLEELQHVYYQELQKFPNKESIISKTYKRQYTFVCNSINT